MRGASVIVYAHASEHIDSLGSRLLTAAVPPRHAHALLMITPSLFLLKDACCAICACSGTRVAPVRALYRVTPAAGVMLYTGVQRYAACSAWRGALIMRG